MCSYHKYLEMLCMIQVRQCFCSGDLLTECHHISNRQASQREPSRSRSKVIRPPVSLEHLLSQQPQPHHQLLSQLA